VETPLPASTAYTPGPAWTAVARATRGSTPPVGTGTDAGLNGGVTALSRAAQDLSQPTWQPSRPGRVSLERRLRRCSLYHVAIHGPGQLDKLVRQFITVTLVVHRDVPESWGVLAISRCDDVAHLGLHRISEIEELRRGSVHVFVRHAYPRKIALPEPFAELVIYGLDVFASARVDVDYSAGDGAAFVKTTSGLAELAGQTFACAQSRREAPAWCPSRHYSRNLASVPTSREYVPRYDLGIMYQGEVYLPGSELAGCT
jgi:hypothetical protein